MSAPDAIRQRTSAAHDTKEAVRGAPRARLLATAATAVALTLAPALAAAQLPTRPVLPLELAQRMVDACVELAREEGWPIAVAVKDTGGHLLAFARLENASTATVDGAMSKAATSAATPVPTRALADFAFSGEGGTPTAVAFLPNVALFAGGLPVQSGDGQALGAIGVSGVTPDQDERCAQTGIDAIEEALR